MTVIPFNHPVLQVRDLSVSLTNGVDIVRDISFTVHSGEIVGLVGESGSGKTTIATALLGATRSHARISSGNIIIDGQDLANASPEALRKARGSLVAHVAQDPATALNPMHRIGRTLEEVLEIHAPELDRIARAARIAEAATDVGLPHDPEFLRRFPHQLSGGQQQRVLLALAVILRTRLIILDEPTTALDVSTQARVIQTLRNLCAKHDIAAVYVSHDLAVVRSLVNRVIVLYSGRVVEAAPTEALFANPAHPYTQGLLAAVPDLSGRKRLQPIRGHAPTPLERPEGCAFAPRCDQASALCSASAPQPEGLGEGHSLSCHHGHSRNQPAAHAQVIERLAHSVVPLARFRDINLFYGPNQILFDVNLTLNAGLCTALVGESGSGKTSLARAAVGLIRSAEGTLIYDDQPIAIGSDARDRDMRRKIQYIFQNPYRALNPRQSVGQILRTAVRHFFAISRAEADQRVAATLERVALPPAVAERRPRELSGGERQRVAIARALICEPDLLICDEITSALDVSVQASIIALLQQLQTEGLTILFVTHDLAVVRVIADEVAVLHKGRVVEQGPVDLVLDRPTSSYTQGLMADSPRLEAAGIST